MSYSKKYLKHFSAPSNVGELENPDAKAEVEHTGGGCFDRIRITLNVSDDRIETIQFMARACSGTIAASSAATSWATGKTVSEATAISADLVAEELGGVPDKKRHSVELAAEAVQKVIEEYRKL